jgi:hypothetical protein
MRTLIFLTLILALSTANLFATTNPEVLLSSEKVLIEVAVGELAIFTQAEYNAETEVLSFATKENISIVQIFNSEGELEFSLPVMSNNVKINRNLFEEGLSTMGFILEGQSQLHTTQVTVR